MDGATGGDWGGKGEGSCAEMSEKQYSAADMYNYAFEGVIESHFTPFSIFSIYMYILMFQCLKYIP